MDLLKAIDLRVSRRSYIDKEIGSEVESEIRNIIDKLNEESGLNLIYIKNAKSIFDSFKKSYGLIKGVKHCVVLAGNANDEHLYEKLGYYGEILVLKMTLLDVDTCWISGSFDRKNPILSEIGEGKAVFGVISCGYCEKELSGREKMVRSFSHMRTKKAESIYSSANPSDQFLKGIDALMKAPTAMNTLNFHVTEKDGEITMSVPSDSSNSLCNLGIGKLHFEIGSGLGKFELGNGGKLTMV